jgi:hypothetical protein
MCYIRQEKWTRRLMMRRLIDAEALLEKLKGTPRYFDVKHDIEEMPTAYDVEKVVAEIEKLSIYVDISNPTSPIRHEVCAIHPNKAIEIVRKGKVE